MQALRVLAQVARLLAALTIAGSAAAQTPAPTMSADLLRPHLIRLADGRRLNFHCIGRGAPTVVFEQGGEGMIYNWAKVQPATSAMTRTCFYDRAGFGWSDPAPGAVTARAVTDDLHELLRRGDIKGPIVLVGHSIGGFYATMYADRFSDDVAGLVLVEPGFAGQNLGTAPDRRTVEQASMRQGEGALLRCAESARTRRLTQADVAASHCAPLPPSGASPAVARYAWHAVGRAAWYEAEFSQSVNFFSGDGKLSVSQQEEQDARRDFGAMPLIVLSAEHAPSDSWRTPEEARAYAERWRAGHAALAARSSVGRHEVVAGAGHFIQLDRPDAVIAAVRETIEAVRAESQQ